MTNTPAGLSIAERAAEVMRCEPATDKTAEILASFAEPLNARRPLFQVPHESIDATHGTNFAAVVQALRNANGQLVPYTRLAELGIQQRTGETAMDSGLHGQSPPFVSVGRLHTELNIVGRYALIEAGHGNHFWGQPKRMVLSEAANIPVIVIGDLVDPDGKGKASHEEVYVKNPTWVDDVAEDHPFYGWTYEQVGQMMDAIQTQGERVNIRVLLVWDPEQKGRNEVYRDIVREVIEMISAEQKLDYSDVCVHMLMEATDGLSSCLTGDDVKTLLGVD